MNTYDFRELLTQIDWTAVGTWLLAMVGAVAARYAWLAAHAANETLRLEVEPLLAVKALGPNTWLQNDVSWSFENVNSDLKRASGGTMSSDGGLEITNVGRGVAVDLRVEIVIEPKIGSGKWTPFELTIVKLSPNEAFVLDVHRLNDGDPFRIFARGATRVSVSQKGHREEVTLANASDFPHTI
jgi:hypothetical protein